MTPTHSNAELSLAVETGRRFLRNRACQLRFRVVSEVDGPYDVSLQVILRAPNDLVEQDRLEAEQHCRLTGRGDEAILSFSFLPRIAGEFALKCWRLVIGPVGDPAQSRVYELPGQDLYVCVTSSTKSAAGPSIRIDKIEMATTADRAGDNKNVLNILPQLGNQDDEQPAMGWQAIQPRFAGVETRTFCGFAECGHPLPPRGNFTCSRCRRRMCPRHKDRETENQCQLCAEQLREEEFETKSRELPTPTPHHEKVADAFEELAQQQPAFDGRIWTERGADSTTGNSTRDIQAHSRVSKNCYLIGEEFTVKVQADRDCYVTILDLGTSGNLFVLLKNYRLRANLPATLSGPDEQQYWRVSGPPGIERMKAMFTLQSFNVFPGADCFALLKLAGASDMLANIRDLFMKLNTLSPSSWTDAACEFVIEDA